MKFDVPHPDGPNGADRECRLICPISSIISCLGNEPENRARAEEA
jgi:hypothetical protein